MTAIESEMREAKQSQLREALDIVEYHCPCDQILREIENSIMLQDSSGMGALKGCMATLLTLRGFKEGPAITVEAEEVSDIWADLGDHWTIGKNYIKPYPVCRWAHTPLDGLRALMAKHGLDAARIARSDVCTFRESASLFPGMPETTREAQ